MMKILHVVHQFMPDFLGGVELYSQKVAALQAKNGHETAIFTPSIHSAHTHEHGVEIFRVPLGKQSRIKVFLNTFYQPKLLAAFEKALDEMQPDLVHLQHLMGQPAGLTGVLRRRNIPYLITLHDYWYFCANAQLYTNDDGTICDGPDAQLANCGRCMVARGGLQLPVLGKAFTPLLRRRQKLLSTLFEHAARVIAPTEFVRHVYRENGFSDEKMVLLRHGIEFPTEQVVSQKDSKADERFHIVYIGGIAPQKGVHHLIEAFKLMAPSDVKLSIAGHVDSIPAYGAELRSMADGSGVDFLGRIPRSDVWALLGEADVIIIPTLWYEASPAIIDEAFIAGTPIIASAIGAMREKIEDKVNGLLVPPGDSEALAAAINKVRNNPALLQQLRAGIKPVRSIDQHCADLEALYKKILT